MLKGGAIYLASGVLNKLIPFLLLPVLTAYLTPAEYGHLALLYTVVGFGVAVAGMALPNMIIRNFYKLKQDALARLISNVFFVLVINCLAVAVLVGTLLRAGVNVLDLPEIWIVALPLLIALASFYACFLAVLQCAKRPLHFAASETSQAVIGVALSLVFVVLAGWGWQGRALGGLIGTALVAVAAAAWLRSNGFIRFDISRQRVREIYVICGPLIFHLVSNMAIAVSDRLFIDAMIGKDVLGVYAVGCLFGSSVGIVTDAFNRAWSPWLYETLRDADGRAKRRIVRYTYVAMTGILVLAVLISAGAVWIMPLILDPAYKDAGQFVIWIALGFAVRGMYSMVFPYLVHTAKTGHLAYITSVAALANLLGNYLLIGVIGALGAALATLVAYVMMFLGTLYYAHREYPMPWLQALRPGGQGV